MKNDHVKIVFRCEQHLKKTLKILAAETGHTLNAVIIGLLKAGLELQDKRTETWTKDE